MWHSTVSGTTWIKLQTCMAAILLTVQGELWARKSNLDGKTPRTEHCLSLISHTNVAWKLTCLKLALAQSLLLIHHSHILLRIMHCTQIAYKNITFGFSAGISAAVASSLYLDLEGLTQQLETLQLGNQQSIISLLSISQSQTTVLCKSYWSARRKPQSKWVRNGF